MIHFVGAGSGAPDLITVRGQKFLREADVVIYAGSLVNPELLKETKPGCEILNSAYMTLDEVIRAMEKAEREGKMTVRLHTGDPAIYGAIREQMDRLEALGIPPETVGLMLIRPISGSGALGVGSELIQRYGPDSLIGRTAAVMLGSTETTFYTIAVYFGAAGIRNTRYAIPAALCADLCGFVAASWAVRLFFGG